MSDTNSQTRVEIKNEQKIGVEYSIAEFVSHDENGITSTFHCILESGKCEYFSGLQPIQEKLKFLKNESPFYCKLVNGKIEETYYKDGRTEENINKLNCIINNQTSAIGRNETEILLSKALNIQDEKSVDIIYSPRSLFYGFNGNPVLKKVRNIFVENNSDEELFRSKVEEGITPNDIKELVEGNYDFGFDFEILKIIRNHLVGGTFLDFSSLSELSKNIKETESAAFEIMSKILNMIEGFRYNEPYDLFTKKIEEEIERLKNETIEKIVALKGGRIEKGTTFDGIKKLANENNNNNLFNEDDLKLINGLAFFEEDTEDTVNFILQSKGRSYFKDNQVFFKNTIDTSSEFLGQDNVKKMLEDFKEIVEKEEKIDQEIKDKIKVLIKDVDFSIICCVSHVLKSTSYDYLDKLEEKLLNNKELRYVEHNLDGHAILLKIERTNAGSIKIIPYDPSGVFTKSSIATKGFDHVDDKTNYEAFLELLNAWKKDRINEINEDKLDDALKASRIELLNKIEFAQPKEVENIRTAQGDQGFCSYHSLALLKTFADKDKYNNKRLNNLNDNEIKILKNNLLEEARQVANKESDEVLKNCYLKQVDILNDLEDKTKIKEFIVEHVNQAPFYIKNSNILMTDSQFECNRVVNTFLHSISLKMVDYYEPNNEENKILYNEIGELVFKISMGDNDAIKKLNNNKTLSENTKNNLKKISKYLKKYLIFSKNRMFVYDMAEKNKDVLVAKKKNNLKAVSKKPQTDLCDYGSMINNVVKKHVAEPALDDIDQNKGEKKRVNGIFSEVYLNKLYWDVKKQQVSEQDKISEEKTYKIFSQRDERNSITKYAICIGHHILFNLLKKCNAEQNLNFNQIKELLNFDKIARILSCTEEIEFKESGYSDEEEFKKAKEDIKAITMCFKNFEMIDNLYNDVLKQFKDKFNCGGADAIDEFLKTEPDTTKKAFGKLKVLNQEKEKLVGEINNILHETNEYNERADSLKSKSDEYAKSVNYQQNKEKEINYLRITLENDIKRIENKFLKNSLEKQDEQKYSKMRF